MVSDTVTSVRKRVGWVAIAVVAVAAVAVIWSLGGNWPLGGKGSADRLIRPNGALLAEVDGVGAVFDGSLSCAKVLAVLSSMTASDRDKIAILAAAFVRIDPAQARTLQIIGVPRNSGSGDAYDYRWTPDGDLRFAGPLGDYSILETAPFIVRRPSSGEFTCEAS